MKVKSVAFILGIFLSMLPGLVFSQGDTVSFTVTIELASQLYGTDGPACQIPNGPATPAELNIVHPIYDAPVYSATLVNGLVDGTVTPPVCRIREDVTVPVFDAYVFIVDGMAEVEVSLDDMRSGSVVIQLPSVAVASAAPTATVTATSTPAPTPARLESSPCLQAFQTIAVLRNGQEVASITFNAFEFDSPDSAVSSVDALSRWYGDAAIADHTDLDLMQRVSLGTPSIPYIATISRHSTDLVVAVPKDKVVLVIVMTNDETVDPVAIISAWLPGFVATFDGSVGSLLPDYNELPPGWGYRQSEPVDIAAMCRPA